MLNEVRLIGRLGDKPEVKQISSGKKVTQFSVATWESYFDKNNNKWEQITEWHRVVCWGDQADRIAKMNKGDLVFVSGSVRTREYMDRDNNKRYTTEIVGFAKSLPNNHGTSKGAETQTEQANIFPGNNPDDDDDLPF